MLSRVLSASVIGIDAHLIEVEVDSSARGLPHFSLVGLPDMAVKESRDRIRAALITPAIIYINVVIPAKAGIQN